MNAAQYRAGIFCVGISLALAACTGHFTHGQRHVLLAGFVFKGVQDELTPGRGQPGRRDVPESACIMLLALIPSPVLR